METKIAKLWEVRENGKALERGDAQRAAALLRSGQINTRYGREAMAKMATRVKQCVL